MLLLVEGCSQQENASYLSQSTLRISVEETIISKNNVPRQNRFARTGLLMKQVFSNWFALTGLLEQVTAQCSRLGGI
jgi:hypothetical protein